MNIFPALKSVARSREYISVSEANRDKIVYNYLFENRSHRWMDEKLLNQDSEYSRGWISMGVLHHIGLTDEHKGFFNGKEIKEAIEFLALQNKTEFKSVIASLLRLSTECYSQMSLDNFQVIDKANLLVKQVGSSQYTDGVRIDKGFHDIFNPPNSPNYTERGSARPVFVLFNNKVFEAEYRYEGQTNKNVQMQSIRFRKALKEEFRTVFLEPQGRFYIQAGRDMNHFVFTVDPYILDIDSNEEHDTEYDEGREYLRLHMIRERRPEVIKKAKDRFIKKYGRLYCEACGFDFQKIYGNRGQTFIEGHHTKLVSEMNGDEKTKVEDIALLCSNCHRMIHKKPVITVAELANLIRR